MATPGIIEKLQNRVNELEQQINNSANFYNSRDNELKQLLQNHNTLVGQFNEAKTLLNEFNAEQQAEAEAQAKAEAEAGTPEHE